MRSPLFAAIALSLLAASEPSLAAPCKDAKGRFIKCPDKPAAAKRCKDTKSKFAKCGAPGGQARVTGRRR